MRDAYDAAWTRVGDGSGFFSPVNDLPPVATGSHIDTQPTGGKFDEGYGVRRG